MTDLRQQVLVLYLATSALDDRVVGWSTATALEHLSDDRGLDEPPYETGLDARKDGWRMIQASQLLPPQPGHEYDASFLKHEFFFGKLVPRG